MSNIFITGGTGFLGSELICKILSYSKDNIYALVRGKSSEEGKSRLFFILDRLLNPEVLTNEQKDRIQVFIGDITREKFGLDDKTLSELGKKIDAIYHSAAVTDLNLPWENAERTNVIGTKNVLDFALFCKKCYRLSKVNYISTAYIVGRKICMFKEDDFDIGQKFNNTYERSKFEAERLILEYRKNGLDVDVFRPGIILGRYTDGMSTNFKMSYQPLHFLSFGFYERIPLVEISKPNLINVDIASEAILRISSSSNREKENMTYHIVSPEGTAFDYILTIASDFFGFKKPELVPPEKIDMDREYSAVLRNMIEPYIPYFNFLAEFDMRNTESALKKENFSFPRFDEPNFIRLFEYCDKIGFIKRKKKKNVVIR